MAVVRNETVVGHLPLKINKVCSLSFKRRGKCRIQEVKFFCKNSFRLRMNLEKGWEQGRNKKTQEDYPTMETWKRKRHDNYPACVAHTCNRCR